MMKLASLDIKNFHCIGSEGFRVIIDNIVVLIGPNNVGKSTILKAYECFSSTGAALGRECFHKESDENPIEICGIFHNIDTEDINKIGEKWIYTDVDFGESIKVKWEWDKPNEKGKKFSWDDSSKKWVKGGMGGFDSLISSCVPTPLKINPTDDPKELEKMIIEILAKAVKDSVNNDTGRLNGLIQEFQKLAQEVQNEISQEISETCNRMKEKMKDVFPEHDFLLQPDAGDIKPEKIIAEGSHLRIVDPSGETYPLSQQGTGLQRTFIWAAIGTLAELGRLKRGKTTISAEDPRMLLIEEPESFLHPPAVRAAREALYNLATVEGWQIMITTHSPIFIDVSKPHTTIVRVERTSEQQPKVFSTDKAEFEGDERERLRMIRSCHPTVNEFFFADHVVLVEGDTEQVVLNQLIEQSAIDINLHVVNCMGKANLTLFAQILNHFGTSYTILHDSDSPKVQRKGKWIKNSMWTMNEQILKVINERNKVLPEAFVIAHVPDFEQYYFGELQSGDKPYNAYNKINSPDFDTLYPNLKNLVTMIAEHSHPSRYGSYGELCSLVQAWVDNNHLSGEEQWDIPELVEV